MKRIPLLEDLLRKNRVLVVDDEDHIRLSLSLFLIKRGFLVDVAEDGQQAKEMLARGKYFLVITDIFMPAFNGLDLLQYVKTVSPQTDVVIISGNPKEENYTGRALRDGAFWYFDKPFKYEHIVIIIERILERQKLKQKELEFERIDVEKKAALESILLLAQAVDAKDPYTKHHSKRVSHLSVRIAKKIGYDESHVRILEHAGLLHDIGKIGIPEQILNKEGTLTDVEFSTMRKHPETGETIISQSTFLRHLAPIIRSHHENFDGSGYPDGKKGCEIPEESRILRIADYFDAVTSLRPYRIPLDPDKALEEMDRKKNRVFDSLLVDAFLEIVKQEAFAVQNR